MMKLLGSLALFAAALTAGNAAATVLTFDDAFDEFYDAPIVREGYRIGNPKGQEQHFHLLDSEYFFGYSVSNGTGVLFNDRDTQIEIALAGGGLFTLADFDAAPTDFEDLSSGATSLVVTGYRNGVAVGSLSGLIDFNQYLSYSAAALGQIDRVTFDAIGEGGGFSLDNISLQKVAAPVPEPSTWALMLTGFGVAGVSLRRRRSTARPALA